jgi:hypoxanthine-DNA glycosylase
MKSIQGFPPISGTDAQVLILGSMPSEASLKAGQYYAHPRNSFWRIIENLFMTGPMRAYEEKKQALIESRIALWDVLQECVRPGSLDSAIDPDSIVANDFAGFYEQHQLIRHVFFNGSLAEKEYMKRVYPDVKMKTGEIHYQRLPSTSPAMASLSFDEKLEHWRVIRDVANNPPCDLPMVNRA